MPYCPFGALLPSTSIRIRDRQMLLESCPFPPGECPSPALWKVLPGLGVLAGIGSVQSFASGLGDDLGSVQKLLPILLEGIWLAGEARRRSIALTSVTEEQRSQRAKQPFGAGRHRAICVVPRSVEYLRGYTPCLGPRIWPGGAPPKPELVHRPLVHTATVGRQADLDLVWCWSCPARGCDSRLFPIPH